MIRAGVWLSICCFLLFYTGSVPSLHGGHQMFTTTQRMTSLEGMQRDCEAGVCIKEYYRFIVHLLVWGILWSLLNPGVLLLYTLA